MRRLRGNCSLHSGRTDYGKKQYDKKTGGYDKEFLACLTGNYPEQKKALATIVARQGSAPEKSEQRWQYFSTGRIVGTIGGQECMESHIRNQCLHMLKEENPQSRLVLEDMSGQEAEEEGLVCGGRIRVFLEVL